MMMRAHMPTNAACVLDANGSGPKITCLPGPSDAASNANKNASVMLYNDGTLSKTPMWKAFLESTTCVSLHDWAENRAVAQNVCGLL